MHVSSYNDILPKSERKVKGIFIRSLDEKYTMTGNPYVIIIIQFIL
jgi:hypothetical protein